MRWLIYNICYIVENITGDILSVHLGGRHFKSKSSIGEFQEKTLLVQLFLYKCV